MKNCLTSYSLDNAYSEAELELSSSSLLVVVSQTSFFRATAGFVAFFSLELELELLSDEDEEEEEEKARVRVLRFLFGFTNGVVVVAAVGWGWGMLLLLLLLVVVVVDGPGDVLFRYVFVGLIPAIEAEIGTGGGGGSA